MGRGERVQEPGATEHGDGEGERAEIMLQTFFL